MKTRVIIWATILIALILGVLYESQVCFLPYSIKLNSDEVIDLQITDVTREDYYHTFRWLGGDFLGQNTYSKSYYDGKKEYSVLCLYAGFHKYYCLSYEEGDYSKKTITNCYITKAKRHLAYKKYEGYTVKNLKTELGQPIFDSVYGNKREIRYLSEGFFLFDCNVYIFNIENDIVYSAECKFVGI